MLFLGDYTTDLGYVFYQVPLAVVFVSVAGAVTDLDPDPYLPITFKLNTRQKQRQDKPCALRVKPRESWLVLPSGDYFRVVVPFQVGSPFWLSFHSEVQLNILIAKVNRKPEQIDPYVLSLLIA